MFIYYSRPKGETSPMIIAQPLDQNLVIPYKIAEFDRVWGQKTGENPQQFTVA
jgi:hypothetical protein